MISFYPTKSKLNSSIIHLIARVPRFDFLRFQITSNNPKMMKDDDGGRSRHPRLFVHRFHEPSVR